MIDIGVKLQTYNSDLTRNFVLGRMSKKAEKIYNIVYEAQQRAIQFVKPGVKSLEIDSIARNFISEAGYGDYFGHSLGHGIGLEVHEYPYISKTSDQIIREGMVFTIEPGIYLPGEFGIRIEDTVIVNKNGCEILTKDIRNK